MSRPCVSPASFSEDEPRRAHSCATQRQRSGKLRLGEAGARAAEDIDRCVLPHLQMSEPIQLMVTGHGFGGALATQAPCPGAVGGFSLDQVAYPHTSKSVLNHSKCSICLRKCMPWLGCSSPASTSCVVAGGPIDTRKKTNAFSTNMATAYFMFFDRGTFWVLPLTYFYLPKSARAYLFLPKFVKIRYFCSGPIMLTPFVRNQSVYPNRPNLNNEGLNASKSPKKAKRQDIDFRTPSAASPGPLPLARPTSLLRILPSDSLL